MADKPSFDERLAALIRDTDSETHKAVVEATAKKSTAPASKPSTPAKK